MTTLKDADIRVAGVERELEYVHRVLYENVRGLAERLSRLGARLEAEGLDAPVNPLGEVQGLALDIDRACALLIATRASRDVMRAAVNAARVERR